eukprot:XP_001707074.1 Hypothetical protein GL50803_31186 [Giardia lamblia ATCC 50803]
MTCSVLGTSLQLPRPLPLQCPFSPPQSRLASTVSMHLKKLQRFPRLCLCL